MFIIALALSITPPTWVNVDQLRPLSATEIRNTVPGHSTRCPGDISLEPTYVFSKDGVVSIYGDPANRTGHYRIEAGGIAYTLDGQDGGVSLISFYADQRGNTYRSGFKDSAKLVCLVPIPNR